MTLAFRDPAERVNLVVNAEVNRTRLTDREKTLLVDALRHAYTLPELLEELGLARSSYFCHRARHQVADKYVEVRRTIADIFERNHRCFGYRRMTTLPAKASSGG